MPTCRSRAEQPRVADDTAARLGGPQGRGGPVKGRPIGDPGAGAQDQLCLGQRHAGRVGWQSADEAGARRHRGGGQGQWPRLTRGGPGASGAKAPGCGISRRSGRWTSSRPEFGTHGRHRRRQPQQVRHRPFTETRRHSPRQFPADRRVREQQMPRRAGPRGFEHERHTCLRQIVAVRRINRQHDAIRALPLRLRAQRHIRRKPGERRHRAAEQVGKLPRRAHHLTVGRRKPPGLQVGDGEDLAGRLLNTDHRQRGGCLRWRPRQRPSTRAAADSRGSRRMRGPSVMARPARARRSAQPLPAPVRPDRPPPAARP